MATANAQFAIDTLDLRFHRVEGNDQFVCNLRVGPARDQERENTSLLRTEQFKHVTTARRCCSEMDLGKAAQQRAYKSYRHTHLRYDSLEQRGHLVTFVEKETLIPCCLSQSEGFFEHLFCLLPALETFIGPCHD